MDHFPQLPDEIGIRQCAMTGIHPQSVTFGQRVQVMVRKVRIQPARQHDGAKNLRIEREPNTLELRPEERMVKARVMGDQQSPRKTSRKFGCDVAKRRSRICIPHLRHVGGLHFAAAAHFDQRGPAIDSIAVDSDDANFGDAIDRGTQPGGFDVDKRQRPQFAHSYRSHIAQNASLSNERSMESRWPFDTENRCSRLQAHCWAEARRFSRHSARWPWRQMSFHHTLYPTPRCSNDHPQARIAPSMPRQRTFGIAR